MIAKTIPVEACISSNVATLETGSPSLLTHIIKLGKLGAVLTPCCDDTMPMNTNIQAEYFEFIKLLKLSKEDLKVEALRAVECIFDESSKETLRKRIEDF